MDSRITMLKELTDAPGLPGYEHEVQKVVRRYLEPYAELETDNLGSIIGKKSGSSDRPRIMIAGHMDEIGFIVTQVTKEGFIKFIPLGGWWEQVMLAQRVVVKTAKGDVIGVIGSKPPHLLSADERGKVVQKKDMFIDIGAKDKEQAEKEFGVRLGDPIIPVSEFTQMSNEKLVMAKALDCRAGVAIFIDVIKELSTIDHPNTVYGVGTVQEEVGLRGAGTSAAVVKPDICFALDVGIAGDMPGVGESLSAEKLGNGPTIMLYDTSMVPHLKLRNFVVDLATELGIPHQFNALLGGGYDSGKVHTYDRGVPSLVIALPTRYIHSHTGIIHMDDYAHTVRLLVELIKRLDEKTVRELLV
ncbi:MAG: M42 family metallopeptidase [Bacillota bacterium]